MWCAILSSSPSGALRRVSSSLWLITVMGTVPVSMLSVCGAQPIDHVWSRSFGDSQRDLCFSVTADPWGNLLLTGSFEGELTFGSTTLVSAEGRDVFLAKLDPAGEPLWARSFGAYQTQHATAVAADAQGNVVLTGYFQNRIDLGGGEFVSAGGWDIFVAKFAPDGSHLWSRSFGDYADQWGTSADVDGGGNVYLAGYFRGALDFGGGYLPTAGGWDVYLVRLEGETGAHAWSQRFGDPADQIAAGVDVNESGQIALSGTFAGTVDFGGGPMTAHTDDAFVAVYASGGECLWARGAGDYATQTGLDVSIAPHGAVAFTGEFEGTIDLGGGPLTSAGLGDVFLAAYDAGGVFSWSQAFGDDASQEPNAVAFDASGDRITLACTVAGDIDFGGGWLTGAGERDAGLALFGADGTHLFSQLTGDAEPQYSGSVDWSVSGSLLYGGFFRGTIDLGGGPLTTAGDWDIFVASYRDPVQSVDLDEQDMPLPPDGAGGSDSVDGSDGMPSLAARLTAFPNPCRESTTLLLELPGGNLEPWDASAGSIRLGLFDASGRCSFGRWFDVTAGDEYVVSTTGLPAGVYFLRVAGGPAPPEAALPQLRITRIP